MPSISSTKVAMFMEVVSFGKEDVIRDKIISYLVEKIELLTPKQ